jgi:hypothetical protein
MKLRRGFVSNSSTSSFLLIGVQIKPEIIINNNYDEDGYEENLKIQELIDIPIKNAQYSDSDDESLMVWSGAPCYKKGYGWYIGYSLGDADDYYMPHDEDQIHITFEKMKSIYPKIKHLTNDDIPRLHVWKDRV